VLEETAGSATPWCEPLILGGLEETESALRAGLDDPGSVKVMVHP
jgi:hypothetical protein